MNNLVLQNPTVLRRKKEFRRGITYSIMLCGSESTGKTTFANNLLESNVIPYRYTTHLSHSTNLDINPHINITKPTHTVTFSNSESGIDSLNREFDPSKVHQQPGVCITSTSVEISSSAAMMDEELMLVNIVEVMGQHENFDSSNIITETCQYLEQQFISVLAEETRVRRNPRFEDNRVHVALYFLEATGHGLRETDVEMMKALAKYTNVLPIISKADSFTPDELEIFKKNICHDIELHNVPVYKFDINNFDDDYDDYETIQENKTLASLQPFSVICSQTKNDNNEYIREYPWGEVHINDDSISDLKILKSVLFGSHLQEFKDTTHNLLYEDYRAEKLLSVTNRQSEQRASAVPSLSNFASLVTTGQFKSTNNLNNEISTSPDSPSSFIKSEITSESTTPIIKQEEIEYNHTQVRNISETVPYALRHERIAQQKQKLEDLEAQSVRELQQKIADLERKAHELKQREKSLQNPISSSSFQASNNSFIKKEETFTDLASIVSGANA